MNLFKNMEKMFLKAKIKIGRKNFSISRILPVLLVAFVLRIVLSFLPSFEIDMGAWFGWAGRMAEVGPGGFYSDEIWTQYTPLFLYWLWFGGKIGWISPFLVKIPIVFADIITGYFIWKIINKKNKKLANLCFILYVLNPIVIFTGSVWGQIDGLLALFMLLSFYFLIDKKNMILSSLFIAGAFLLKPQALVVGFPLLFIALRRKFPLKAYLHGGVVFLLTILILSFPFFPQNPMTGLSTLVAKMVDYYNYTSLFAFNFWSVVGMWIPDSTRFLGITYQLWGAVLFFGFLATLLFKYKKAAKKKEGAYLLLALVIFASFLFPTRVHERYLFPMFAPLLVGVGLYNSTILFFSFAAISMLNFINLYHPYAYYTDNFLRSPELIKLTGQWAPIIGILSIVIFIFLVFFSNVKKHGKKLSMDFLKVLKHKKENVKLPKVKLSRKKLKIILILIFAFSFIARIIFLNQPKEEYFDEVYHAFTAKRMLHGDPKAWEWWNASPEGFAYEWTHPPLAKLGMVLGMAVFGENSFGWRIPGALLGVGSVVLIYLIAKKLFKDELVGLLSASVFALEGLPLVVSRIGMNDSYFLFFSLLTFYMLLVDKFLLLAISFGLAASSKWSTVWLAPVLFVSFFTLKKKFKVKYLLLAFIPPLIYLASYIPMFLTGHGFDIFIGVQKQMWWYHTGLEATHSYTSSWWSWPFLVRPIYLYTSNVIDGTVARIYAMGNPIVFWSGIVSVILAAYFAFIEKNKRLGLVVFSYFVFFASWAASPRIMFLYHYLPSIPFMAIAIGFVIKKFPRIIIPFLAISLTVYLFFFPHLVGLHVPVWLDKLYYWFPSWR